MVQHKNKGRIRATYPSKILGFVEFPNEQIQAAIITSSNCVPWERRVRDFISPFRMNYNNPQNYAFVPLSAILFPLLVFPDMGGDKDKVFCAIPKRNWGDRFDNKIGVVDNNIAAADASNAFIEVADADFGIGAETVTRVCDETTRIEEGTEAGSDNDMCTSDSACNGWEDSSDSE